MSQELVLGIYVFIMAIFVGFEVISRVPSVLHTPLMSGTNAIHGIVVLGAMLVAGSADSPLLHALGFIAVVFGAVAERRRLRFRRRRDRLRRGRRQSRPSPGRRSGPRHGRVVLTAARFFAHEPN